MRRTRIAGPDPRILAAAVLGISAVLAVATLAARNLYDDEITSLPIITGTVRSILDLGRTGDVHPPGMYLLAHIALWAVPSFRWMNLVPTAVLYTGLAVFVVNVAPLFRNTGSRVLFLFFAALHPQLLLWGTSFRWYSWWTGLALITLIVALQPRQPAPELSNARSLALGTLLGALFYINYITLLFALCLAAAMVLRYRHATSSQLLWRAGLTAAVFLALAAPQFRTLLRVYSARGSEQRSGIAVSAARLLQGTLASEAYLPWHPLAILMAAALAAFLTVPVWRLRRRNSSPHVSAVNVLTIFAVLLLVLMAVSGLGGKPRSGLLLIPVLAVAFARAADRVPARVQRATLLLMAVWTADGVEHMLRRTGLSKSMMTDRPEQVAAFVQTTSLSSCAVVATFDPALAFAIAHPPLPSTVMLSPFAAPIGNAAKALPEGCTQITLYLVYSYVGGNGEVEGRIGSELDAAARLMPRPPEKALFSFDPDAARRREVARWPVLGRDLTAAEHLPDYRYTVAAGPIQASALPALRSRLPDFCAEDCSSKLSQ